MTNKFNRMCSLYRMFASDWDCDFSEEAKKEMYEYETFGRGYLKIEGFSTTGNKNNGYAVGKKWLNVQVSAWRDEIKRSSFRRDFLLDSLYSDDKYKDHHGWLDDVLGLKEVKKQFREDVKRVYETGSLEGTHIERTLREKSIV